MGISPSVDFPAVKSHPVKKKEKIFAVFHLLQSWLKTAGPACFWLLDVFVRQNFKASK